MRCAGQHRAALKCVCVCQGREGGGGGETQQCVATSLSEQQLGRLMAAMARVRVSRAVRNPLALLRVMADARAMHWGGDARTATPVFLRLPPTAGAALWRAPWSDYPSHAVLTSAYVLRPFRPYAFSCSFLSTKLMTRLTYTLDEISGKATVGSDGSFSFQEQDGIDYAPTTVQLPGGERVPFLFTVKELDAKGSLASFGGDFTVPSYRGSSFLDPKGRGGSLGRDAAKALPAASTADEYEKENIKETTPLAGSIVFNTAKVDAATGEIAGIFESIQPSDTDLGSKAPKDVKIEGVFYAQLE